MNIRMTCFIIASLAMNFINIESSHSQNLSLFFPAVHIEEQEDTFGNVYSTGPQSAIVEYPIDEPFLIREDNKWFLYPADLLDSRGFDGVVSNGPGSDEDAPEIQTNITVAFGGTYEVKFHYMDSTAAPGEGKIQAAVGDEPFEIYSAENGNELAGGSAIAIPNEFGEPEPGDSLFFYDAVIGEVTVEAGETITIRVDDTQEGVAAIWMVCMYQGITLTVLEGGPDVITVNPLPYQEQTDKSGNRFNTTAMDDSLAEDTVWTAGNSSTDNLWRLRDIGIFGNSLVSRGPRAADDGNEDCPALRTSVTVQNGGTYEVFLMHGSLGTWGEDNRPCPLSAAIEGNEMMTFGRRDGNFLGKFGFNIIESSLGTVTVADQETVNVIIEDIVDHPALTGEDPGNGDYRSVYSGLRLQRIGTAVPEWYLY